MLLFCYAIVSLFLAPFLRGYLLFRLYVQKKEEKGRLCERFGKSSLSKAEQQAFRAMDQKLIWLHGVSVGESLSLLSFIHHLKKVYPKAAILMTTGTVTAAHLVHKRLPDGAIHQYVPLDVWHWVRRFFNTWKPDVVVITESEIWPNLLSACKKRNIPLYLINGRMTEKSFKKWYSKKHIARTLFGCFTQILTPSEKMMHHFYALLGSQKKSVGTKVSLMPNLKFAAKPLLFDAMEYETLKESWKNRMIITAASTHRGEEEMILGVFKGIVDRHPNALLVLVPRHPKRTMEVMALIQSHSFSCMQRSKGHRVEDYHSVYVVDTLGDMGLVYALSNLVIMGGSFVPHIGGHNPIEPALKHCCIIHGPFMENARDICDILKEALIPSSKETLLQHVLTLLENPDRREAYAQKAYDLVHTQKDILRQLVQFCGPHLQDEKSILKNENVRMGEDVSLHHQHSFKKSSL